MATPRKADSSRHPSSPPHTLSPRGNQHESPIRSPIRQRLRLAASSLPAALGNAFVFFASQQAEAFHLSSSHPFGRDHHAPLGPAAAASPHRGDLPVRSDSGQRRAQEGGRRLGSPADAAGAGGAAEGSAGAAWAPGAEHEALLLRAADGEGGAQLLGGGAGDPEGPPVTPATPAATGCLALASPALAFGGWLRNLGRVFGWPVLVLVTVTYGVSQGYASSLSALALNYYWKDVQQLQPAQAQFYMGWVGLPWTIKPVYGMITDTFPLFGYKTWPYIASAGLVCALCWLLLFASPSLPVAAATALLVLSSLFLAVPDVVVDGLVAGEIRAHPAYAADMQSLPWGVYAIASLLTFLVSGKVVRWFGPQGTFFFVSLAYVALLVTAVLLPEARLPPHLRQPQPSALWRTAVLFVREALRRPILKASLFLFIVQGGLYPDISSGTFYWLTDAKQGPGFTPEFLGMASAVGQLGMLVGIVFYNRFFKQMTYRSIFALSQILLFWANSMDLILVTRANLDLGIPDPAFVLGDSAIYLAISRLQAMPVLVLAARLCPEGVEATLFAFLMSVLNCGKAASEWWGAALLSVLGIRRDHYNNLWVAVTVRMFCRLVPLLFLSLLPEGGPEDDIADSESAKEVGGSVQLESDVMLLEKGGEKEHEELMTMGIESSELVHRKETKS